MKHHIVTSADGSNTLKLDEFDECYHSSNGAYSEAMHIYIKNGVEFLSADKNLNIYDIGLGTALNCITTLLWQQEKMLKNEPAPNIHYIGIEKFPIEPQEALLLNFPEHIHKNWTNAPFALQSIQDWFGKIHTCMWEEETLIAPGFYLTKHKGDITLANEDYFCINKYKESKSVVFYDTFSPATQPQLWDKSIFERIYNTCNSGSVLVTYCSKGIVKQSLRDVGFTIERLQGPPGKRHIIRACKK